MTDTHVTVTEDPSRPMGMTRVSGNSATNVSVWQSDDAVRARTRMVEQADRVYVEVQSRDGTFPVETLKSEAYRLLNTRLFLVSGNETHAYLYAMGEEHR